MAQEMGARLGDGALLLGPLPQGGTETGEGERSALTPVDGAVWKTRSVPPSLPGTEGAVQDVAEIVAEFAARPWLAVTEADLGPAARVPTMLTAEDFMTKGQASPTARAATRLPSQAITTWW